MAEGNKEPGIVCSACGCTHWPNIKHLNINEHFHCPNCNVPFYVTKDSAHPFMRRS